MAYESFDNINQHDLQAVIEAEMNLFENSSSSHTYTTMQGFTFQPLLVQQQQFHPNILQMATKFDQRKKIKKII